MNRYRASTHRVTFAIAAAATTTITIAMLVVVPAMMDSGSDELRTLAHPTFAAPASAEVTISQVRFDVIGVREPNASSVHTRGAQSKPRQHG